MAYCITNTIYTWGFDVVTVNPYMGFDSMKPFLEIDGKGAFVVCRSSNNSAAQIQDILVQFQGSEIKLYEYIYNIVRENDHNICIPNKVYNQRRNVYVTIF